MTEATPKWIWRGGERREHEFVRFYREFELAESGDAILKIAAETDFTAYLDGEEVMRGQFSDYPDAKTYSDCDLHLESGSHRLEIEVYYCGIDFQTSIIGTPGVWATLELPGFSLLTDDAWLCRVEHAFLRDRLDKVDAQLGMVIGYDARKADTPDAWESVVVDSERTAPTPRPEPSLENGVPVSGRMVNQGYLKRRKFDGTYAEDSAADLLFMEPHWRMFAGDGAAAFAAPAPEAPWHLAMLQADYDGYFLIVDFGQEIVGLEEFDWEFPAGTVVDIAYGEHLTDGRVRCRIHDRNFVDRYIAGAGRRRFTMPRRVGCRYIELHIIPAGMGSCTVFDAAIRPRRPVLPEPGEFSCDDINLMALCRNSARTLELCMHEHYEDCPWREQALYAYDSRNQILYGNYLWGNADFAATSLELLGRGLRPDGVLALCAPSRIGPPIPIFSFSWITAVCEHYLYHGRGDLFGRVESVINAIMDGALARFDAERGLYSLPAEPGLWNFYEWREGLDGSDSVPGEPDALYNLYLLEALDNLAWTTDDKEMQKRADALREAIFRNYYAPERGCMLTRDGETRTHEVVQALALYNRCVPEEHQKRLITGLMNGTHVPISYSSIYYFYRALLSGGAEARAYLAQRLMLDFGAMAASDSTTMWETNQGDADFDNAGSLCHGWSALPLYYFFAIKLGIRPLEPGFRIFEIAPAAFSGDSAHGEIPTPLGKIQITIRRTADGVVIDAAGPSVLKPRFSPWSPDDFSACYWNSEPLEPFKE